MQRYGPTASRQDREGRRTWASPSSGPQVRESGQSTMSDCLIIVGMHRSGTSALAGAIHRLGVTFGSDIVAPQEDNVRGYYEHRGILGLHENLLAAQGSSWDDIAARDWSDDHETPATASFRRDLGRLLADEFGSASLWAVKDPRLCHLLPAWRPVLSEKNVTPHVVIAHRAAAEVAASLAKRNGFSPEKSNALWVRHILAAERSTRGLARSFVDFSSLLEQPIEELERLAEQLDVRWPVSTAEAEAELSEFLDVDLRHTVGTRSTTGGLIADMEAALTAAEIGVDEAVFDELGRRAGEVGAPDPLVVEHLHQFARRETQTRVWAAKEPLQHELTQVSNRLGDGLARAEAALAALSDARSELASRLEREIESAREHDLAADRSVEHLTAVASNLEEAVRHHAAELDDVRLRLDRLQHEVLVEARLEALRTDLDFLARETRSLREIVEQRTWWQRFVERLAFWRSTPQPE